MSEKIFSGPSEFADFFKENPDMLGPFPWASSLINHLNSLHVGCKCNLEARKSNVDKIYSDIVTQMIGSNAGLGSILKKQMNVEKVIFKLKEKVILEV